MPKIAMPSCSIGELLWTESLDFAIQNNFDAFEIDVYYPSVDLDIISMKDLEKAKIKAEKAEMEICVHAPFFELNIGGFCKGIREESIRYMNKSVDFCSGLGGNVLIVHSGNYTYYYPEEATLENNLKMKTQWDNNIKSLKKINEYANTKGVTVCLENSMNSSIDQTFEDLLEIRDAVGDSLKFTLDMGHARLQERRGVERGIRSLGDNIRHIHLTDNHGINDDHLPIGDGNFDYSDVIDFIKNFPYIVTLEVINISTDSTAIIKSREYIIKLLNDSAARYK